MEAHPGRPGPSIAVVAVLAMLAVPACDLPDLFGGERSPAAPLPTTPSVAPPAAGIHPLTIEGREGRIYVPPGLRRSRPAPLIVFMHGAGGGFGRGIALFREHARERGAVLVDPVGGIGLWGPVLRSTLRYVFERFTVDRERMLLVGFSDGASSALSEGLAMGDLFTHIAAMSPGFMDVSKYVGRPEILISHGRHDPVLPFEGSNERFVPELRSRGYHVRFIAFEGGHETPRWLAEDVMEWFFGPAST